MRVIFICHQDFANFSYEKCESLRMMGVDCDSFVLKPHPFGYAKQSKVISKEDIQKEIARADLIHVMHSCGTMWDFVKESGKRIIVWHTGTRYRSEPEKHNARWNPIVERSFYALGEFEKLGCKNGEYFSVTIDTDLIKPIHENTKGIMFAHYPSNPSVKGTQTISRVYSLLRREFRGTNYNMSMSVKRMGFTQQLKRMSLCDVYIEMCAAWQGGKPYGSWGTTALESAALGKVCITNFLWEDVYKRYYGEHKLVIANNPYELDAKMKEFISMDRETLSKLQRESREWVVEKHGRKATGERLIKYL